jgi:hypothetical protein
MVAVAEDAERLLVERVFGHAVEMPGRGHRAPADEEGGVHVRRGPVEDARQLLPVGHVLEGQQLDRRAGDDEAVEPAVGHLLPGLVEGDQVILRRVLGLVRADAHQRQLDLQRRRADQPGELRLGADLVGHQVEQADLQRPDVLAQRRPLVHDGHALAHEHVAGGKIPPAAETRPCDGHRRLCARQERRAGRRQALQAVVERKPARRLAQGARRDAAAGHGALSGRHGDQGCARRSARRMG